MRFLDSPPTTIMDASHKYDWVDYQAAALEWGKTSYHGRVFFLFIEWDDIPEDIRVNAEINSARVINAALEKIIS